MKFPFSILLFKIPFIITSRYLSISSQLTFLKEFLTSTDNANELIPSKAPYIAAETVPE